MTLAARRGSRLRLPIRNGFLGEPDDEASAIAKRRVIVPPIGDPVFLTGNMMPAFAMKFERHDSSPGQRRETSGLTILKLSLWPHPCTMCGRPRPCKKFLTLCCHLVGCGHVSGLRLRRVTAGPDEVRGLGLNQSLAVITACCMTRYPNPRFDRLASRCLVTLAKLG